MRSCCGPRGDRAFCAGLDTKKPYGQPDDVWNHEDPGEAAQPEVAEGVEAGGVRGAGHVHGRRVLLPQRVRRRDLLAATPRSSTRTSPTAWSRPSSRSASCAGSAWPRRCGWPSPATTSASRAETALRIGLVTEVVERDRLWAGPTSWPPASPPGRGGHAGHGAGHLGVARPPVPRRHGAGPDLHPAGQPLGMAEVAEHRRRRREPRLR